MSTIILQVENGDVDLPSSPPKRGMKYMFACVSRKAWFSASPFLTGALMRLKISSRTMVLVVIGLLKSGLLKNKSAFRGPEITWLRR